MTQFINVRCEWCEKEAHFMDEDPVEDGWFRLVTSGVDGTEERDYCSTECMISDL